MNQGLLLQRVLAFFLNFIYLMFCARPQCRQNGLGTVLMGEGVVLSGTEGTALPSPKEEV